MRTRGESCGEGTADPAEWRPGDDRVVIVRPSAPTELALVTPIDRPALAWQTLTSKAEEVEAVVAAAAEAMEQRLAMPGEAYRPLRAANRALDVMRGLHAPETDAEAAFVASLAKGTTPVLFVASTRDDEDFMTPGELVPNEVSLSSVSQKILVVPSTAEPFGCQLGGKTGDTRLEAWGELVGARDYAWPCDDDNEWDAMINGGFVDCGRPCMPRPIQVDPNGIASCKIHVAQPELEQCDPEKGWRDPDGKETFVERYGETFRRCEVMQHEGAALESCRTSPDCPGCKSGFCVADFSFDDVSCDKGMYPWFFRFTAGARAQPYGYMEIACTAGDD
ncbi:hypothetical protein [Polyangium mundeleinium]|uniref:Lipoprotein n=1 Tax=Polyangium mundeleinium TaxID=2995306 RepID=A0ABT5F564_9BACT|nr:hypothetical protein [Polyangium mundeleinium]MDC0748241.1 hypothetical protein [Polyangium mundeleinium]